jgi:type 2 lantibiotic, SP_1948 family
MKNDFVIGKSLKELSLEEMQLVYGGTDGADPRSTIICSATLSFIASYLGSAQTRCGKYNKNK